MKPHTAISAIYQPLLREKLERQGVAFAASDFLDKDAFLSELAVTGASHAIAYISVLEPRIKRELQGIRRSNPDIQIIIVAPVGTLKDKKLMDVFTEFNVRVVEDGSRNLVESILKIIEDTSPGEPENENADEAEKEEKEETNPEIYLPDEMPEEPAEPTEKEAKEPAEEEIQPQTDRTEPVETPREQSGPPTPSVKLPAFRLPRISLPSRPKPEARAAEKEALPHIHSPCRLHRQNVPVVIPVFSGSRGAGCTWLAVQIAAYIAKQELRAAVCGPADICLIGSRYIRAGDTKFTLKGVDFYPYAKPGDLISAGYDYILFDVGLLIDFEPDGTAFAVASPTDSMEVMRAACKIMVNDLGMWRQSAVQQILTKSIWKQLADTTSFAASCRSPETSVSLFTRQHNKEFVRLPMAEPFEINADVTVAIEQLLQPILK